MHIKSNPKIGYGQRWFSPAVVNVCPQPSTSPRHSWCQDHSDVLGQGHTSTTAWDRAGAARRHGPGAKTMIILRKNHLRRPGISDAENPVLSAEKNNFNWFGICSIDMYTQLRGQSRSELEGVRRNNIRRFLRLLQAGGFSLSLSYKRNLEVYVYRIKIELACTGADASRGACGACGACLSLWLFTHNFVEVKATEYGCSWA